MHAVGDAATRPALLALLALFLSVQLATAQEGTRDVFLGISHHAQRNLLQDGNKTMKPVGKEASCNRHPYIVSIRDHESEHRCSGVLIDPSWVLTAAHCINDDNALQGVAVVGGCKLSESVKRKNNKKVASIVLAVSHPMWNGNSTDGNDIALLKLDPPSKARPITYVTTSSSELAAGQRLVALGWNENLNGKLADKLRQDTDVLLIGSDECAKDGVWGSIFTESMLCAAGFGNVQPGCGADDGAPLLVAFAPGGSVKAGSPNGDILVGITSFGETGSECGEAKKPGVYTRISKFRDWIDSTITASIGAAGANPSPPPPSPTSPLNKLMLPSTPSAPSPELPPPMATPAPLPSTPPPSVTPAPTPEISAPPLPPPRTATTPPPPETSNAPPDSPDDSNMTPIETAIKANDTEQLRDLIANGEDVNAEAENGDTPLILAATDGLEVITEILLEAGADPDAQNPMTGATALHVAAFVGHVGVAELLIPAMSDVDAKEVVGFTPLHFAARQDHLEIVNLLIDAGAGVNERSATGRPPITLAALMGHEAMVDELLDSGANPVLKADGGITILMDACSDIGTEGVLQILMEKANLDVNDVSDDGSPAIEFCAFFGNKPGVEVLLANEADPGIGAGDGVRDEVCGCTDSETLGCPEGACESGEEIAEISDLTGREAAAGSAAAPVGPPARPPPESIEDCAVFPDVVSQLECTAKLPADGRR